MSMDFLLVENAKYTAYFKQVEKIYLDSFPVTQVRPTKTITCMLEFDPFNEVSAAFLEFMAIDKAYRVNCALYGTRPWPHDMYLMSNLDRKLAYLKKSFIIRVLKSIYLTIYHYDDDSNLLDLTIEGLPPTIRLI